MNSVLDKGEGVQFVDVIYDSPNEKSDKNLYMKEKLPEDFALGLCLSRIDVAFIFGVDSGNKLLFTPIKLDHLLRGDVEQES